MCKRIFSIWLISGSLTFTGSSAVRMEFVESEIEDTGMVKL